MDLDLLNVGSKIKEGKVEWQNSQYVPISLLFLPNEIRKLVFGG